MQNIKTIKSILLIICAFLITSCSNNSAMKPEDFKNKGFDLKFKRMWEFYLSYCEAGFKSKNIDLIQFSLQKK